MRKTIDYYVTYSGECPFRSWFEKLDRNTRIVVDGYIARVSMGGSKKNIKSLKDGLYEIRIFYGSGIRVYFGKDGDKLMLLLIGGAKGSQKADIKKAKSYWRNYVQTK